MLIAPTPPPVPTVVPRSSITTMALMSGGSHAGSWYIATGDNSVEGRIFLWAINKEGTEGSCLGWG
jgi:hypothetical protein